MIIWATQEAGKRKRPLDNSNLENAAISNQFFCFSSYNSSSIIDLSSISQLNTLGKIRMFMFADIKDHGFLHYSRTVLLPLMYLLISSYAHNAVADTNQIKVIITDPAPYHVHPPGQSFKIFVEINAQVDLKVMFFWRDFEGNTLSTPARLTTEQPNSIISPSTQIGYYELVLKAESDKDSLPNREPGEERAYGFAIMPHSLISDRSPRLKSKFGIVHADISDPYLPTWVKTMTWNTTSPKWWNHEMEKRRLAGKLELPILSGKGWDSDDAKPISSTQLEKLKNKVKSYFSASPSTIFWETGIEENIKARYRKNFYWKNLERKLKIVREAANEVNNEIKLIYQIAGLKQKAVKNFAQSRAARFVDILSIHPYAWPNFPSPETWHDNYVVQARQELKSHGLNIPIWYTEVGATQHGNAPGGFFGYPKKNKPVTGLTPYQASIYLIKLHVMAFHAGIEKVFWYNYKDRASEREYAENHFGLREFLGHPKPVYVAYSQLQKLLTGKTNIKKIDLAGDIFAYEFSDNKAKVLVLWSFPASPTVKTIPLASLMQMPLQNQSIKIINPMGKTMPLSGDTISISGTPIYLITTQN